MPEWLVFGVLIWLAVAVVGGRRCGFRSRAGRVPRGPRRREWRGVVVRTGGSAAAGAVRAGDGARRVTSGPGGRTPVPARRESVEERLQREFVQGRLSLEEYEAALWEELGPGR